jgi:hypothetical protein
VKAVSNGSVLQTKGSVVENPKASVSSGNAKTETATTLRKYILGPRGGCYYLNENGAKVYVRNKELCTKP